jgi:hypothetical protein
MPKFYVQSGNLKLVTTATSARGAAIWAVHRALSQSLPFLRDEALSDVSAPAIQLGETIQISEQGFDRPVSRSLETLDVVTEWNQLVLAIDRLEQRLAATVLQPEA